MRDMPLPECLGTVVVHQGDAVTCTRDTCTRDLSLESWFSHHTSFMTCRTNDCPHCGLNPRMQVGIGDGNPTSSAVRRGRGRLLEPEFGRRASS